MANNIIEKIVLCCFVFLTSVFYSATAQTRVELKPGLFFTCTGSNVIIEEEGNSPFVITIVPYYSPDKDESYYLVSCSHWQKQVEKSKLKQTIKEAIIGSASTTGNTLACRFANLLAADIYNTFLH